MRGARRRRRQHDIIRTRSETNISHRIDEPIYKFCGGGRIATAAACLQRVWVASAISIPGGSAAADVQCDVAAHCSLSLFHVMLCVACSHVRQWVLSLSLVGPALVSHCAAVLGRGPYVVISPIYCLFILIVV